MKTFPISAFSKKQLNIDRACSFPYYFLRTHCQNISVFNMIDKYTVSSFLYPTSATRFIPIKTPNSHFSLE